MPRCISSIVRFSSCFGFSIAQKVSVNDEDLVDDEVPRPAWLTESFHARCFLSVQYILSQLQQLHEGLLFLLSWLYLHAFAGEAALEAEFAVLLQEASTVCGALSDLLGDPVIHEDIGVLDSFPLGSSEDDANEPPSYQDSVKSDED